MPGAIQRSARETVKDWFLARKRAEDIASKSVGDLSISYHHGSADEPTRAIPARAYSRLQKWRRLA